MVTRMYLKTIPSLEMVLRMRWEMDALVSMRMVDTFVIVELLEQRGGVPAVVQHPHGQSLLGDEEVTHQFLQSQQALGLEMRTRRWAGWRVVEKLGDLGDGQSLLLGYRLPDTKRRYWRWDISLGPTLMWGISSSQIWLTVETEVGLEEGPRTSRPPWAGSDTWCPWPSTGCPAAAQRCLLPQGPWLGLRWSHWSAPGPGSGSGPDIHCGPTQSGRPGWQPCAMMRAPGRWGWPRQQSAAAAELSRNLPPLLQGTQLLWPPLTTDPGGMEGWDSSRPEDQQGGDALELGGGAGARGEGSPQGPLPCLWRWSPDNPKQGAPRE